MSSLDVAGFNRMGQVFTAANVSVKSVIAVNASATGLILYNPYGSGKIAILVDAGFSWTTAPAAVHNIGIGIMGQNATAISGTTAAGSGVKVANGMGTAGAASCAAYDAVTLPAAPVAARWWGGAAYASAAGNSPYFMRDLIDGAICLVPGSAAALIALTTTCLGVGSFTWIEVPQ